MSDHISTVWPARPTGSSPRAAKQLSDAPASLTWLTNGLLALASCVLLALACASAWLSYHAQIDYVLAHNGNQAAEAKVWALLLDTGTAGVSLLRLYETLRRRPGIATRISLLGCITASVTMNMLHAPSHSPGGYLVASVPPVMYAVFLEHLLTNLRSLLMPCEERRSLWRTLALWCNFPTLMWSGRRSLLRRDAEDSLSAPELVFCADDTNQCTSSDEVGEVAQAMSVDDGPGAQPSTRGPRRGRGPGPKRVAFEEALTKQVRTGDLRLFSDDERERNAAAYQAAASLPAPLSRGTARRYVMQALSRLEDTGAPDARAVPDNAP